MIPHDARDRVCIRQHVDPESLGDAHHDTVVIDQGASEINVVLNGVLVIQIMVSADRQYTIFDAKFDGAL